MEKIKVLRIIARLNIGGPAIHTVLLTEGLDKSVFESWLVCGNISRDEGDMRYYAAQKNVTPVFISGLRREVSLLDDLLCLARIYRIIREKNPDIIHTHTAKAGTLGRLAGIIYNSVNFFTARKRARLVHTFHGHVFDGYFNRFKSKIFILIERFLASFTFKVITVSQSLKEEIVSFGVCAGEKIEVIPLGFELDKFMSIAPRNNDVLNVGIVGRLVPIKNHRLFLLAASKIIARNPAFKVRFKVIGDGELRDGLIEYAKKINLSAFTEFLGWQKDLPGVYSDLDIVALVSLNEGTPVSLIEGMASARAVVSTEVGGVADLLGDKIESRDHAGNAYFVRERGLSVRSGDPVGLSAALNCLLEDKQLRLILGQRGREFARQRFAKSRLIADIEKLYKRAVAPAFNLQS